jgi:hypothetical protein
MLRSTLTVFMLPMLLLLGSGSDNSAAELKQQSPNAQTETTEKLIVASGSATIDLDLAEGERQRVDRLVGARDGDFRVVVFRHTTPLLPKGQRGNALVLSKTAEELPGWIANEARQQLDMIGGRARVTDCTEP